MRYYLFLLSIFLLCTASFAKNSASVMLYAWDSVQKEFKVLVTYGIIDKDTQAKGWDFLGGKININETPQQAAVRAIYEKSARTYGSICDVNGNILKDNQGDLKGKEDAFKPTDLLKGGEFQPSNPSNNKHYFYFKEVKYVSPSIILNARNKETSVAYKEKEDFGWVSFKQVYVHAEDLLYNPLDTKRTLNVSDNYDANDSSTNPFMWVPFETFSFLEIINNINNEELKRKRETQTFTYWSLERTTYNMGGSLNIDTITVIKEDSKHYYCKGTVPNYIDFNITRNTPQESAAASRFDYMVLLDALEFPERKILFQEWTNNENISIEDIPGVMVAPQWCVTFRKPYENKLFYQNQFYKVNKVINFEGTDFYLCQLNKILNEPVQNVTRTDPTTVKNISDQDDYSILGSPNTVKRNFPVIKNETFLGVYGNGLWYEFPFYLSDMKDYYVLDSVLK